MNEAALIARIALLEKTLRKVCERATPTENDSCDREMVRMRKALRDECERVLAEGTSK